MAIFQNIETSPEMAQLLQRMVQSGDQGWLNVAQRIGHGSEFPGEDPLSVLKRIMSPGEFSRLMGTPQAGPQDLGGMSDADLMSTAQGLGIDTAQFNTPVSPVDAALRDVSALNVDRGTVDIGADVRGEVANIFEPQRQQFLEELRRNTVELAGQRGLGFGDADIPQRVAERLSTGLAGFRGQEAQSLLQLAEQARQNRLQQTQLREQGLQGRAGFFEGQRRFENQFAQNQQTGNRQFMLNLADFQNRLRQQAFANRQAISGQFGATGLGLAGTRSPSGSSSFNPANQFSQMGTGLNTLGTGLQQLGGLLGF